VNCEDALDAVISSNSSTAKIGVDVLTYSMPEQIIVKKTLNVGGLPPVAISKAGKVASSPTKVLSVGDPITTYVDLSCTSANNSSNTLRWGFNSSNYVAEVLIGSTYTISMSCESSELWLYAYSTATGSPECNYQIVGG
jgi:hypothetical protein